MRCALSVRLFNIKTREEFLIRLLVSAFVVFLILPLRELAKAFTAYKLGDKTVKYNGGLDLNPLAHVDPIGAIGIFLFSFGWAKSVPIDSRYFRNPKRDKALVALAGPVANFLAALIGGVFYNFLFLFITKNPSIILTLIILFFKYFIIINVSLAVFSLLPLPGLDGGEILEAFLSNKTLYTYYRYKREITIVSIILIFTGLLRGPLVFLQSFFTDFIIKITNIIK